MQLHATPFVSLHQFAHMIGRTPVTVWRWRKLGWIPETAILNVAGKPYITAEGIQQFKERAQNGEFAKEPHAPKQSS